MLDLSWTSTSRPTDPSWQIHIADTDVNVVRHPPGPNAPIREYPSKLSAKQLEELRAVLTHYGVHDFPARCFSHLGQGKLTWRSPGTPHEMEFGVEPDPLDEATWLHFPVGAADVVVRMFEELRSAVYGATTRNASYWRLPALKGVAAGTEQPLHKRPLLKYKITEPNMIDQRQRYRCTTWYFSGRVVQETLLVGKTGTSRTRLWKKKLDATDVASQARMLWDKKFFNASTSGFSSGSSYDGEEIISYVFHGSQMTKTLSYEVEMGARCGLSETENWGLDWIRALERQAERHL